MSALHIAALENHIDVAALLINYYVDRGTLTSSFFEYFLFDHAPRESLLQILKQAMRRRHRCQLLWMSSDIPTNDRGNILNLLPADLTRSVSNYF